MSSLSELRWQCRRGKLELDIVLRGFMDQRGAGLSAAEQVALGELLTLSDDDLLDCILGKAVPSDALQAALLAEIVTSGRV
ncbi:MAG: succinate dehydrogenase assembly factor 2 [Gammaproteobacteria bacterium]|nr:succinate dehydrogenase assembly factor 2 [Gammaproteobacteria bacterium]